MSGSIEAGVDRYMNDGVSDAETEANATLNPQPSENAGEQGDQSAHQSTTAPQQRDAGGDGAARTDQPVPQRGQAGQQPSTRDKGGVDAGTDAAAESVYTDPQRRAFYKEDEHGNLLDASGKNVVARAGTERRYFTMARDNYIRWQEAQRTAQTAQQEAAQLKQQVTLPQSLGLNQDDVHTAMQFMSHWKRDMPGAARKMIADFLASGHTLDGLTTGLDMQALGQMMDTRLQPFVQERAQQQQVLERQSDAQRQVQELFTAYPWAEGQQTEIIAVMDSYPGRNLTMREAAAMLEQHANSSGYDLYGSPLVSQVRERNSRGQTQRVPAPQQPNTRPNAARMAPPLMSPQTPAAATRGNGMSMDASVSTRDILRAAFAENGLQAPE